MKHNVNRHFTLRRMKFISFLIFTFFLISANSQDILIKHINVIDVNNKEIKYDRTILIVNGRIQNISKKSIRAKKSATVINGTNKFIIPGLWDMHVHTVDSSYLKMFIINGVTGIRDMGGAAKSSNNGCESIAFENLMNWRKLIQAGTLIGPRMLISGPVVSNTGWPSSINIRSTEDAQKAVMELKSLGVDFIKVYEDIPLESYLTLAKEAKANGLTMSGHVPVKTVSLIEASDAGHRSIEHIRDHLLMSFTDSREELLDFFKDDNWSESDIEWGLKQFEQTSKTIQAFKNNQTWLVPTLTVEWAKIGVKDSLNLNDEKRKILPKSIQLAYKDYVAKKLSLSEKERKSDSLWWTIQKRLVNRMHKEAIPFMAGTDCACEGGIPGYSLHKELQLFVEAGLTPFESLQTATINPARFLKLTDSLGTSRRRKNCRFSNS